MTITAFADIRAGVKLTAPHHKTGATLVSGAITDFYNSGYPTAATANTAGVAGTAITNANTATTRAVAIPTSTSPVNNYLARVTRSANVINTTNATLLVDRLWHNSGLNRTLTTAQTVNSVAWPARDIDGATSGNGVYIAVETSTGMGTGAPTITMSYTNSAGVAGRTSTNVYPVAASAPLGTWNIMGLQAGDVGVQSVQTMTFSATWGTVGTLHLVAFRPLILLPARARYGMTEEDFLTMGGIKLWNNTILQAVHFIAATQSSSDITLTVSEA